MGKYSGRIQKSPFITCTFGIIRSNTWEKWDADMVKLTNENLPFVESVFEISGENVFPRNNINKNRGR